MPKSAVYLDDFIPGEHLKREQTKEKGICIMSIPMRVGETQQETQLASTQPPGGLLFDTMMIIFSCWFMGGLFLDGWAHTHIPRLETFFTPWHAVLYSGYLSVALFLLVAMYRNHMRGYAWSRALPSGYELSLLGAGIFAV